MKKPAARIGDLHQCPAVSPGGVPHAGGPIVGPGSTTVWIEGAPAATEGDACLCVGGLDKIITGSTGVFIEGREVARQGDRCAHGGTIEGGSRTVFIGDGEGELFYSKPHKPENKCNDEEFVEPPPEEKEKILNGAIKECICLLERKLELLGRKDCKTMEDFKKWFGWDDEGAVELILNRIRKILHVARELKLDDFGVIEDDHDRMTSFAMTNSNDEFYVIHLGDLFWKSNRASGKTNGSVIAHELSHLEYVGLTRDFDYGTEQCLYLAENSPRLALFNAESFEYFIKG